MTKKGISEGSVIEKSLLGSEEQSKKKKAAIYVRVSTDEQEEMYGEKAQLDAIQKYIALKSDDLELAGEEFVFRDTTSGAKAPEDRPGFSELLEYMQYSDPCPFDVVIVHKIDRFARKLVILLDIVENFAQHGIGFISTKELFDTETAFGKAMLGILGVFAELERDVIKERTHAGIAMAHKEGVRMQDLYGYRRNEDKRPEVEPKEAGIIRDIFEEFVDNKMSIGQICSKLKANKILIPSVSQGKNKNKYTVKDPTHRTDKTVRTILENETYVGKYYYNKTKTIKGKQIKLPKEERTLLEKDHEAIVSDEIFQQAQVILSKKNNYKNAIDNYLLSSLIECDCCKADRERSRTKRVGIKSHGQSYYQCGGKDGRKHSIRCKAVSLQKDLLEKFVISEVKQFILNPQALKSIYEKGTLNKKIKENNEKAVSMLEAKLEKTNLKIQHNKSLFREADITPQVYLEFKSKFQKDKIQIEQDLNLAKQKLRKTVQVDKYVKMLQFIEDLCKKDMDVIFSDEEKTKSMLNYIIESIVIYSRERKSTEKLAGRKADGQMIPYHIEINFKLPQQFLEALIFQEFGDEFDRDTSKNTNIKPGNHEGDEYHGQTDDSVRQSYNTVIPINALYNTLALYAIGEQEFRKNIITYRKLLFPISHRAVAQW